MADDENVFEQMEVDGDIEALTDETVGDDAGTGAEEQGQTTEKPAGEVELPEDLYEPEADAEDDEDDIVEPEGLNPKAKEAFQKMRTRLSDLKKKAANGGDSTALQARIHELESDLEGVNYTSSEAYKTKYVQPIQKLGAEMSKIGKDAGISDALLRQAMTLGRSQRIALLKGATDDENALLDLLPMMQSFDALRTEAQEAVKTARQGYLSRKTQQAEEVTQQRDAAFSQAIEALSPTHFLLRDSKQNPDWLKNIKTGAEKIFGGELQGEELAKAALKAQVSDYYLAQLLKERKARLATEARLVRLRGAKATVDGSGGGTQEPRREQSGTADSINGLVSETVDRPGD